MAKFSSIPHEKYPFYDLNIYLFDLIIGII